MRATLPSKLVNVYTHLSWSVHLNEMLSRNWIHANDIPMRATLTSKLVRVPHNSYLRVYTVQLNEMLPRNWIHANEIPMRATLPSKLVSVYKIPFFSLNMV